MKNWPIIFLGLLSFLIIFPWFHSGYPAFADSLEPAVVSQAIFIRQNWPHLAWNNSWYLGFPFRFNGSPLLPYLLAFLNFIFPSFSLWFIYRLVTGLGFILMTIGIFEVAKRFLKDENNPEGDISPLIATLTFLFLPSILFLIPQVFRIGGEVGFFPWQYLFLAKLGNGQRLLGLSLLPFCLLIIDKNLKTGQNRAFWPVLFIVLLSLADFSSLVTLVILTVILLVSYSLTGKLKKKAKKAFFFFLIALLIVSFYYSPRFWWQWLTAPSLAGARTLNVGLFLIRIISLVISLSLGILMALGRKRKKHQFIFLFLWFFVFSLLTFARFIADIDFWQDYTSWGVELGIGLALFSAYLIKKFSSPKTRIFFLFIISLSGLIWIGKRPALRPLPKIEDRIEYKITQILKQKMTPGERVYLSGSTTFWLNSLSDLWQIRGGQDKAAIHPFWSQASYQIREGENPHLSALWLKALGTEWLVVHGQNSQEPYHDFRHQEKFSKNQEFQLEWDNQQDYLYRLNASIAREIIDPEKFQKLKEPKDGEDILALEEYNQLLGSKVSFNPMRDDQLVLNHVSGKAISLALTFDSNWQAVQNNQWLIIKKDCLGQIIINPKGKEPIVLKYQPWAKEIIFGHGLSLLGLFIFFARRSFSIKNKVN